MMAGAGGSIARPPLLTRSNYYYWTIRMRIFIASLDEYAWHVVEQGWEIPTTTNVDGVVKKPRTRWTDIERRLSFANAKALNAICCALNQEQFMLISTCDTAKEAWDALEILYKDTEADRASKLETLRTQFEELVMDDDETIEKYHMKLLDIANQCFHLGKKYSKEELVRKTLSSLPSRFETMVETIEEMADMSSLKFDELMKSLRDYESNINAMQRKKGKLVAVKDENTFSGLSS